MKNNKLYVQMFSIHGLVRSENMELGRDADTGGQVKYVIEIADRLSRRLINLTKLYGFWRYSESARGMIELDRYCDLIYQFLIKDRSLSIQ